MSGSIKSWLDGCGDWTLRSVTTSVLFAVGASEKDCECCHAQRVEVLHSYSDRADEYDQVLGLDVRFDEPEHGLDVKLSPDDQDLAVCRTCAREALDLLRQQTAATPATDANLSERNAIIRRCDERFDELARAVGS